MTPERTETQAAKRQKQGDWIRSMIGKVAIIYLLCGLQSLSWEFISVNIWLFVSPVFLIGAWIGSRNKTWTWPENKVWSWIGALVWTLAGSMLGALAWGVTWIVGWVQSGANGATDMFSGVTAIFFIAFFLNAIFTYMLVGIRVGAGVGALLWSVCWAGAGAWQGIEIGYAFNRFQIFWVLLLPQLLGLGSGALIQLILGFITT